MATKNDLRYASRTEVSDLSRQVAAMGKDVRETKTATQTHTDKLANIAEQLHHKPGNGALYGGLIAVFSIVIGVSIFLFSYYVPAIVKSELAPTNDKIANTNERLGKIETKLDLFLNILKQPTAGSPDQVKTKLLTAKAILSEAEKKDVALEPDLIQEGALELIKYEPPTPELVPIVWDATTQYADYRSYLNQKLQPVPVNPYPSTQAIILPARGLSRLENFRADNFAQELDHGDWVNPVFVHCTIIYKGGEMRITNARFQDCQFQIAINPSGKKFVQALVSSYPTTAEF
jgi:hypothetical protein